ncbi:MAG: DUF6273 domain-containing protein, partial [Defluviitaleaceae bacterium]|nr:DUF6273 domain-containing protein [Defluviitaleaceae bacterium]
NSEFYQTLEKCHANILDTETEQGVTDKIFLLSVEEFEKYNIPLPVNWWWLRSPGLKSYCVAGVYDVGSAYILDSYINFASGGVRPAMWVDIKMKKGLKLLKSEV